MMQECASLPSCQKHNSVVHLPSIVPEAVDYLYRIKLKGIAHLEYVCSEKV